MRANSVGSFLWILFPHLTLVVQYKMASLLFNTAVHLWRLFTINFHCFSRVPRVHFKNYIYSNISMKWTYSTAVREPDKGVIGSGILEVAWLIFPDFASKPVLILLSALGFPTEAMWSCSWRLVNSWPTKAPWVWVSSGVCGGTMHYMPSFRLK